MFHQQAQATEVEHEPEPERSVLMGRRLKGYVEPGQGMDRILEKAYGIQLEKGIKDVEVLRKRALEQEREK